MGKNFIYTPHREFPRNLSAGSIARMEREENEALEPAINQPKETNMTDDEKDNVTNLPKQGQQPKDPKKAALAKIAEGAAKEWSGKIDAQVKKTIDAVKIANNEKKALAVLIEESEEAKLEYVDLIKEI